MAVGAVGCSGPVGFQLLAGPKALTLLQLNDWAALCQLIAELDGRLLGVSRGVGRGGDAQQGGKHKRPQGLPLGRVDVNTAIEYLRVL